MRIINFNLDQEILLIRNDIVKLINFLYRKNFAQNDLESFNQSVCYAQQENRQLFSSFYDAANTLPSLFGLLNNYKITNQISGNLLVADLPKLRFDLPGETRHNDPWHQEGPYYGGLIDSITIWIPVVDVDESMGKLQVKAGSDMAPLIDFHLSKTRPYVSMSSGAWETWATQEVYVPLGSGFVFANNVIHRSGNNVSINKPRVSIQVRYHFMSSPEYLSRNFPRTFFIKSVHEDLI